MSKRTFRVSMAVVALVVIIGSIPVSYLSIMTPVGNNFANAPGLVLHRQCGTMWWHPGPDGGDLGGHPCDIARSNRRHLILGADIVSLVLLLAAVVRPFRRVRTAA